MDPFENLIHDLGLAMEIPLKPDKHQSCRLEFDSEKITVQIDLDTYGDKILIGAQLGPLSSGSYRERILRQAMRVNGMSKIPRGTLAFSEKNDTLVLFYYLPLATINGTKLFEFLKLFVEHARIWSEAIIHGEIPPIEEDISPNKDRMFGLKP